MYHAMNTRQFKRRFPTERDCPRYLIKRKWPYGFYCPRCGNNHDYLIASRKLYQCTRFRHQTSLTAYTILHRTREPLRDWFWAIFLITTQTTGSSARQLQHDLALSYQTGSTWCHKTRNAMEDRDTRYHLQGMVELDDTYIDGKRKPGKRGRGARSKVPVMVAVESSPQGCGHVALRKVASVTSSQAQSFLTHSVESDTLIVSDGLSVYQSLSQGHNLYPLTLGCGQGAVEIFPDVHRVIARLKTWIRGTDSHVSNKHLNRYLSEFSYRFNRHFKQRRVTIFDRLVTACCATGAVTYRQLVADLSGNCILIEVQF